MWRTDSEGKGIGSSVRRPWIHLLPQHIESTPTYQSNYSWRRTKDWLNSFFMTNNRMTTYRQVGEMET